MKAAFFDMDRTVLKVNSGMSWLKFLYGRGELTPGYMARATYWSLLYRLAILDVESLATKLVGELRGDREEDMREKCDQWIDGDLLPEVSPAAVEEIERQRQDGAVLVLLTGSSQYASEPISERIGIDHTLCSRIEVEDGVFTGRLEQRCFGQHKVDIAERFAAEHDIDLDQSIFYSDSFHDMPMLLRVGEAVAINPDTRLKRHARRAGWRMEQWA